MPLSFIKDAIKPTLPPWKILIVDDEEDIHVVTKLALKRFELEGRKLTFLHAYSGDEAQGVLESESDIALVFLDVVMETDDAGLELARWMRQDLKNEFTRIVLRTGQPGQAPEEKVIMDYDINDYKEKTELNRTKLFTTVVAALRAYRDIVKVEEARMYQELYRSGLERVIDSTSQVLDKHTLPHFFNGLLQQVMSLLRINEQSMLVQLKGIGAVFSENDYEVIAEINNELNPLAIDNEALRYLNRAREQQQSIFENDVLVGYFPSKTNKVSLLYLKGIKNINIIDAKLLEIFSGNVSLAFDNLLLNKEIIDTQEELIYRLGDVVESRSNEAGNHVKRMSQICHMLALSIGMDEEEAELLRQAAPMHDIGKIATPDAVLLKPGKLQEDEMDIMKQHPTIGYEILKGSERPILKAAAIISAQHHEKYDGTGYPNKIAGESIHPYARIAAVADVFDALTHKRCYKEAWPIEEVLAMIEEMSGNHLDPKVVSALFNNIGKALDINHDYQDSVAEI